MKKKVLIVNLILLIGLFFVDNALAETYNNYAPTTVSCGSGMITNIPSALPKVLNIVYIILQIAVPVLLVVLGTLDLFKSIIASKDDEMKKGQGMFLKRLIAAVLIFFVFSIVKLIISLVADGNENQLIDCAECFIKNECG